MHNSTTDIFSLLLISYMFRHSCHLQAAHIKISLKHKALNSLQETNVFIGTFIVNYLLLCALMKFWYEVPEDGDNAETYELSNRKNIQIVELCIRWCNQSFNEVQRLFRMMTQLRSLECGKSPYCKRYETLCSILLNRFAIVEFCTGTCQ